MERPKLVIASVLKPVNDTRMYEKFALSLSQANKYDINIIGFSTKNIPTHQNILFHPIFDFPRISIGRLFAPLRFLIKVLSIKPNVLIVTTHELLIAASFYKLFFKAKLLYDIRENYYLNIKCTHTFPVGVRHALAAWVRLKEWITYPFVDHNLLAEKCYESELPFIQKKFEIIENKAVQSSQKTDRKRRNTNNEKRLLFTGTLAESTGIFYAINLAKNLHQLDSNVTLKIVGFCARKEDLDQIQLEAQNNSFITLIGGNKLVDHERINEEINCSDFGIIYYPKNRANDNAIPTKLYEYLGGELPIIAPEEYRYQQLADPYHAAIYLNFQSPNYEQLLCEMENHNFYEIRPGKEIFWANEELKLLQIIQHK